MPGKDYGPGGKWIHDRAHSMMGEMQDRYGADRGKQIAYATATQQAHKVRKSPKAFRTTGGVRTALRKHDRPIREYQKTACARGFIHDILSVASMRAMSDEFEKIAMVTPAQRLTAAQKVGKLIKARKGPVTIRSIVPPVHEV